jgi:hypothetical protein
MCTTSCRRVFRINAMRAECTAVALLLAVGCAKSREPAAEARAHVAPGCTSLDAPAPVDSSAVTQDVRAGRRYRCVLHAGDAPVRVELLADSATNTIDSVSVRREDGTPIQMLTESADEPPYRGAEVFQAIDFDNDGRLDFALLSSWGATGNKRWNIWRQDTATNRFALDSTLSALWSPVPVAGRPCVSSHSVGGAAGMIYDSVTVCREGHRWVETAGATGRAGPRNGVFLHTILERRGDSLVAARTDTVRDTLR